MRRLVAILFAVVLVLALLLADRLALRSVAQPPTRPDASGFAEQQALGRVLSVQAPAEDEGSGVPELKNIPYSWELVACQVLTGRFAGRVVLCNQLVNPRPDWNIVVHRGDYVALELAARGDVVTSASLRKPALRHRGLLWLVGLLGAALLAFGGWRSARNTLGVAAIVGGMVAGLFPLLARGHAPLPTVAWFSALVVVGVVLLFYGLDRKALAALAGTAGALTCVVAVSAVLSHGLRLTGLETAGARYLVELKQHAGIAFDYRSLLLGGLLVAVVGVAIDTSVSIAAGIEELYRAQPAISRRRAFASGLAIGRDVMGVCATTFVFASIGVRLPVLLCPAAADLAPAELVNTEAGCTEIVRIVACGIGLLAAAPITTLAAVFISSRWRGADEPSPARHSWAATAVMAELAVIVALGVALAEHPAHATHQRPRFASLASGSFDPVVAEANTLLEAYDYPRAILLLWQARERGIEPHRTHDILPRLYHDYLAYVRHYESVGLPADLQARWARSSAPAASRAWSAHAMAELRAALALEPADPAASFNLGRLLCDRDRPAEAIPCFLAARQAQPDNVDLLCDLAAAYTMVGSYSEAEAIGRRLEQLAPQNPRVVDLLDRLRTAPQQGPPQ